MPAISLLRRLRFELGDLTQEQLAGLLGRNSAARLSLIENGQAGVTLAYLESFAGFLACSLDEAKQLCDGSLSDERFNDLVAQAQQRLAAGASVGGADDGHAKRTPRAPGVQPGADAGADRLQSKPVFEG